jgi:hypothetical protein
MEQKSRSTSLTYSRTGPWHRRFKMEYKYKRYRRCVDVGNEWHNFGECVKWKRYWVPLEWTWGSNDSQGVMGPYPVRKPENSATLPAGVTITTEKHDNLTIGGGVTLFGLSLDSEADYSNITELSWTGKTGCANRWLYGANSLPKHAPEIFASSSGCSGGGGGGTS